MRTHSVFIKIFLITSFCFLVLSFVFNYFVEDKIYKDICVGILASSLVSLFSSTCGYFTEKRKAMEEFSIISKYLLKKYGDYQDDWSIEEKIKFYISMYNLDYTNFELSFSKIWLIDTKKQEYIYESIYQSITFM